MTDKEIIQLEKVDIRELWGNEERDFTPWLHRNIGSLGDALNMTLKAEGMEVPTIGGLRLDLLAKDGDGRTVVIENQFGKTDHDHLGKLLAYSANHNADVLIWVTEDVVIEHQAAVAWLNRKTDTDTEFYLVKVEVLQADGSRPGYRLTPVVAPNKSQKAAHEQATANAVTYGRYFDQFIKELREQKFPFKLRPHRGPTRHRHFYCGVGEWVYAHDIVDDHARVYFFLSYAKSPEAKKVRAELIARTEAIEKKWGCKLEWDEWDNYSIGVYRPGSFSDSEESLAKTRKWAVEWMFKLAEAIPPAMLQEIAAKLDAEESAE